MRFVLLVACLSMTVLVQACVTPAEPPAADRPRVDANGDGVVTREEAEVYPRLAKRFGEFDANGDGKISRDELHGFSVQP